MSALHLRSDVSLTPLRLEHAPDMYHWMLDPEVRQNVGVRNDPSLERTSQWIANALQDDSICSFGILLDGRYVGNVVLDRIDNYIHTARLSIYIGEPLARHSGIGSTAIYRVLAYAFRALNLRKVWLTVHARNMAAINAYFKIGFVLEGILRNEFTLDGQYVNLLYMGMLLDDFNNVNLDDTGEALH